MMPFQDTDWFQVSHFGGIHQLEAGLKVGAEKKSGQNHHTIPLQATGGLEKTDGGGWSG